MESKGSCKDYVLYKENLGRCLSLDDLRPKSLSLYSSSIKSFAFFSSVFSASSYFKCIWSCSNSVCGSFFLSVPFLLKVFLYVSTASANQIRQPCMSVSNALLLYSWYHTACIFATKVMCLFSILFYYRCCYFSVERIFLGLSSPFKLYFLYLLSKIYRKWSLIWKHSINSTIRAPNSWGWMIKCFSSNVWCIDIINPQKLKNFWGLDHF